MRQTTSEDYQALYQAFAELNNADTIKAFMVDLCTIREIDEMAQRLEVARLLNDGTSYAKVQEQTSASSTTISRVSKALNHGTGGYHSVLNDEKGL